MSGRPRSKPDGDGLEVFLILAPLTGWAAFIAYCIVIGVRR